MRIVQMTRARLYCERETRYSLVADVMTKNRFEKLVSTQHFKNNSDVTEEENQTVHSLETKPV